MAIPLPIRVIQAMVYARILNPETVPYDPDKDLEPLGLHVIVPIGHCSAGKLALENL